MRISEELARSCVISSTSFRIVVVVNGVYPWHVEIYTVYVENRIIKIFCFKKQ